MRRAVSAGARGEGVVNVQSRSWASRGERAKRRIKVGQAGKQVVWLGPGYLWRYAGRVWLL